MTPEEIAVWSDVGQIIASLATVGALAAVFIEIRKSRQIENRQAVNAIDEKWQRLRIDQLIESKMHWKDYDDFCKKYTYDDVKSFEAIRAIHNFYEGVAEDAILGLVDVDLVILKWGHMAYAFWNRFRDVAEGERAVGKRSAIYLQRFAELLEIRVPDISVAAKGYAREYENRIQKLAEKK